MNRMLGLATLLLLASPAWAGWADLKPGMDANAAVQCVGIPLLQTNGRGGASSWAYDRQGYILFDRGRVSYWSQPAAAKPVAKDVAKAKPAAPAAKSPGKAVAMH